jgi:hypothetical protein
MTVLYAVRDGERLDIRTREVSGRAEAAAVIREVQQDDDLLAVQIEEKLDAVTSSANAVARAVAFSDPLRELQWGLTQLQAEDTWALGTGAGQTVAVIDTGVLVHQDLAGAFVPGTDFITPGGSGRVTGNDHGTAVAGVIAMSRNNNLGGAGLAPDVAIMPVRAFNDQGTSNSTLVAKGINFAVDNGATVINLSLSQSVGDDTTVPGVALERALTRGIDVVAAAGNGYCKAGTGGPDNTTPCQVENRITFPSSYPGVVGVAATVKGDNSSAWFSQEGFHVDISAPGVEIATTGAGNKYFYEDGTSFAAPFVSATLALLRAREAAVGANVDQVKLMYDTARELGAVGRDDRYGNGLVQPLAAMQRIQAPPAPAPTTPPVTTPPVTAPPPPARTGKSRVYVAVRKSRGRVAFRVGAPGRFSVKLQRKVPGSWVTVSRSSNVKGRDWFRFSRKVKGKMRVSISNAKYRGTSRSIVVF